MPWKECNPMDERLKFIARLLDGEKMAGLCREFGISRKTGYKILTRYDEPDGIAKPERAVPRSEKVKMIEAQPVEPGTFKRRI
jgi:transposase-like protein